MNTTAWQGFQIGKWTNEIDVRNFIQKNYTLYEGDDTFLEGVTDRTQKVWDKCHELILEEMKKGILDVETNIVSGIDNFAPGYIDQENEVIVGLQTDAPLKRIVNLYGGMKMAKSALEQYGYELNPQLEKDFHAYRKTHNEGVFDAYPKRTKVARHVGLLTGLPDAYGRGRVIGDYRRVALYGVDFLIGEKEKEQDMFDGPMTDERIRLREEISMQIQALKEMKSMAMKYGVDISEPAKNAKEAVQFLYMAYLAGVKENNGAAISLGRTSTFLDIYIERDLKNGVITEKEAQELIDQFLCFFFCNYTVFQISFNINIEESGCTAQRNGRSVVFFYPCQIRHIQKLYGFFGIFCRFADIHTIFHCHGFHFFQCLNLHADFFSQTDSFICHRPIKHILFFLFFTNEKINTIQSNSSIISNDTSTTIGIR